MRMADELTKQRSLIQQLPAVIAEQWMSQLALLQSGSNPLSPRQ